MRQDRSRNCVRVLPTALAALVLLLGPTTERAGARDFASVSSTDSAMNFSAVNNGAQLSFSASARVNFSFDGLSGLPPALQGPQAATMTISGGTNDLADSIPRSDVTDEGINFESTIKITRNTPYNGLSNLLTVNFYDNQNGFLIITAFPGDIGFSAAGSGVGSGEAEGSSVAYTSDFLAFDPALGNSFSMDLGVATYPAIGNGGFLQSFLAHIEDASFSGSPAVPAVPAPASILLMGVGLGFVATIRRSVGRRRAGRHAWVSRPARSRGAST